MLAETVRAMGKCAQAKQSISTDAALVLKSRVVMTSRDEWNDNGAGGGS